MNEELNTPENKKYLESAARFFAVAREMEGSDELVRAGMQMCAEAVRAVHKGTHPAAITLLCGIARYEARHGQ
jgi:hypothetical protein